MMLLMTGKEEPDALFPELTEEAWLAAFLVKLQKRRDAAARRYERTRAARERRAAAETAMKSQQQEESWESIRLRSWRFRNDRSSIEELIRQLGSSDLNEPEGPI